MHTLPPKGKQIGEQRDVDLARRRSVLKLSVIRNIDFRRETERLFGKDSERDSGRRQRRDAVCIQKRICTWLLGRHYDALGPPRSVCRPKRRMPRTASARIGVAATLWLSVHTVDSLCIIFARTSTLSACALPKCVYRTRCSPGRHHPASGLAHTFAAKKATLNNARIETAARKWPEALWALQESLESKLQSFKYLFRRIQFAPGLKWAPEICLATVMVLGSYKLIWCHPLIQP